MNYTEETLKRVIGSRIMQRRKQLHLKQKELAKKIGLTDNQISNIENGISFPRMGTFIQICVELQASPDYFIVGSIHRLADQNILDLIAMCSIQEQKTILLLLETYVRQKEKE